ncbi:hypothetical protein DOTSEDRAFT_83607 [Dothistroma septosporum NZE10]|uniref:NmrA-like domain-containing protein n=1 Tax=Dothistroma septosporum (strain NZE10 / CBS 128990) TaxID=675120 RepID=M2YJ53_DOTSN|nr:hypothetical protein DOTSEDRAFT_83607 [Dothistroma septosporum NZE10]
MSDPIHDTAVPHWISVEQAKAVGQNATGSCMAQWCCPDFISKHCQQNAINESSIQSGASSSSQSPLQLLMQRIYDQACLSRLQPYTSMLADIEESIMTAYRKVAVAGATGNLGPAIVQGLVDGGFEVTVLSRSGRSDGLPSGIEIVTVDYSSRDSLVNALTGQDAFVSAIPNHGEQAPLIDAAIAAGVKRFLPSDFGSDVPGNANAAALPVFKGKVATRDYLKKKENEISHTFVINSLFLDWGIKLGFQLNLNGTTKLYDNPDTKRSYTALADIGKAVANILKKPKETKNRAVYIQSTAISQNELLAIAKKVKPGFKAETESVSTEQVLKDSYAALEKGGEAIGGAMVGFIIVSIFNEKYGGNFEGRNDNELLGIKEKSPTELEALVKQYA